MNPEFRLWLTSKRTIIRSMLAFVFFFLAYFLQHKKIHSQTEDVVYFISYVIALYFGITSYPSKASYKSEFKQPIGPSTFYAVKTAAIAITVLLIIALGSLSYFGVVRYCSSLSMNVQIGIHVVGFVTAVVLSALLGEHIQRAIFDRIDKPRSSNQ